MSCFVAFAFTYRYALLDMQTVDCSILLAQDTPDALVLAILCDFRGKPEQEVVNHLASVITAARAGVTLPALPRRVGVNNYESSSASLATLFC